jgi:ATP-dependent Lhr-like helicase
VLESFRRDKRDFLASSFAPIEQDHKGIMWHTNAGGFVNTTLRFAIIAELGVPVQATNEYVKLASETLPWNEFTALLDRMSSPGYWENPELMRKIITLMPNYRLSKFQGYLPDGLQMKLVADTILDVDSVKKFLQETR